MKYVGNVMVLFFLYSSSVRSVTHITFPGEIEKYRCHFQGIPTFIFDHNIFNTTLKILFYLLVWLNTFSCPHNDKSQPPGLYG